MVHKTQNTHSNRLRDRKCSRCSNKNFCCLCAFRIDGNDLAFCEFVCFIFVSITSEWFSNNENDRINQFKDLTDNEYEFTKPKEMWCCSFYFTNEMSANLMIIAITMKSLYLLIETSHANLYKHCTVFDDSCRTNNK